MRNSMMDITWRIEFDVNLGYEPGEGGKPHR